MHKVSLITTVFNEADNIGRLLYSLHEQTRRPDEIVIVDAGSLDGTLSTIETEARRLGLVVNVIVAQGCNISEGRNIAIQHASHDLIAVTDAGTVVHRDWLFWLLKPFTEQEDIDVVGGYYAPVINNQLQRAVFYGFCWTRKIYPDSFLPSSRSISFRRDAWKRVGGYPEWLDYAEDSYFDLEMKKAGCKFYFQDKAVVDWEPRKTFTKTILQFYLYGRGDGKAFQFFDEGYGKFIGHFLFRIVLLALSTLYPWLIALFFLDLAWMTTRYRVIRIFWNGEGRSEQLKAAILSQFVSPFVETAMVLGYLKGLLIRHRMKYP